jgi:hypothetical protein
MAIHKIMDNRYIEMDTGRRWDLPHRKMAAGRWT